MATDTPLGMNAKLSIKEDGVAAGGDFIELTNVQDVTLNLEKSEADVTTRGNNGWRARKGTLKDGTIDFKMVWDDTDDNFNILKDAFLDGNVVGVQCLSETDGSGLEADMEVFSFTRNEALEEAIVANVTLKIARSDTPPEWVEAS